MPKLIAVVASFAPAKVSRSLPPSAVNVTPGIASLVVEMISKGHLSTLHFSGSWLMLPNTLSRSMSISSSSTLL